MKLLASEQVQSCECKDSNAEMDQVHKCQLGLQKPL